LPCGFRLRYRSAFNGVKRRKSLALRGSASDLRRFASIPVGGSRNEGAALKRSAPHFDKQDDFKVDWLYDFSLVLSVQWRVVQAKMVVVYAQFVNNCEISFDFLTAFRPSASD
jgi:hypothetical protein